VNVQCARLVRAVGIGNKAGVVECVDVS
jgi:hypothetical protein